MNASTTLCYSWGTARAGADVGRHALCLAVTFALALVVAAAQPAVAAISTIVAERDGNTTDIRASAVLNSNVATAWRVLTDYNRYTKLIPDLPVSRVVARRGATITVEQSGDAALAVQDPVDVTLEIHAIPPNSLPSSAVAGRLRARASSYALTPVASGVRLDYVGRGAGVRTRGPLSGRNDGATADGEALE